MERVLLASLFLVGCSAEVVDQTGDTATETAAFDLGEPSDGECPKFGASGAKTFSSGGQERAFEVYYPSSKPEGMPVIFYWHGLGDNEANAANGIGASSIANDNNAIVVVPGSLSAMLTWDVFTGGEDLVLYDDLRICLVRELKADVNRINTAGFSYGGIFTAFLWMARGDELASGAPMSGGIDAVLGLDYTEPGGNSALMPIWGGESDTFDFAGQNLDFNAGSIALADAAKGGGHPVVACDHGTGHNITSGAFDSAITYMLAHTLGEPSPYADNTNGLDSSCSVW